MSNSRMNLGKNLQFLVIPSKVVSSEQRRLGHSFSFLKRTLFCLSIILLAFTEKAEAQCGIPLVFKNPTLISGTRNAVASRYRFDNFNPALPGAYAELTIVSIPAGLTVVSVDSFSVTSGGYDEAWQPAINSTNSAGGFVEWSWAFKTSTGGSTSTCFTISTIDNDGYDATVEEYAGSKDASSYKLGSQIESVTTTTPVWTYGRSKLTAAPYEVNGIDSANRAFTFEAIFGSRNGFAWRTGLTGANTSGDCCRIFSMYFEPLLSLNPGVITQPSPAAQCGVGSFDPGTILSTSGVSGITSGTTRYNWAYSTTASTYTAATASQWTALSPIVNSTTYNPPAINQTTYYVRLVSLTGSTVWRPSNVVVIYRPVNVTAAIASGPYCIGQTYQLTATSTTPLVNFSWSGPNGFSSTGATPTINSVSAASSGTYTVTASQTGGCSATATVSATFGPCVEICNNFIDDDGDTFIDEADPDSPCFDPGKTLACDDKLYMVRSASVATNTLIERLDILAGVPTLTTLFNKPLQLNALGQFNGFLYAMANNGTNLYRIDAYGAAVDLGVVAGLPIPDAQWSAGTIGRDGNFYIMEGKEGANHRLYRIPLLPGGIGNYVATQILGPAAGEINLPNNPTDIAMDETGTLYAFSQGGTNANVNDPLYVGGLFTINLTTGVATRVSTTNTYMGASLGSLFITDEGKIYGYGVIGSASGYPQTNFYEINKTTGQVNQVGTGATAVGRSDGASCPWRVTLKRYPSTTCFYPGVIFNWEYAVRNQSGQAWAGVELRDTLDSRFSYTFDVEAMKVTLRAIYGNSVSIQLSNINGGTNNVLTILGINIPNQISTSISLQTTIAATATFTPPSEVILQQAWLKNVASTRGGNEPSDNPLTLGPFSDKTPVTVYITTSPVITAASSACLNNPISVRANNIPGVTYTWNYGAGATPATGTTVGPNNVSYSTVGVKTISLIVTSSTGCSSAPVTTTVTVGTGPSLTLGANPSVCRGTTTANLPFTSSFGSPNQYSINFDLTAEGQGFVDVTNATLGSSPIQITVPAGAAAGIFNATVVVNNTTAGCNGTPQAFQVIVNATPTITMGANPSVCKGISSATLPYSALSAGATQYSINFDATAEAQGFVDVVDATITSSPISIIIPTTGSLGSAGTYNATLTVKNPTTGCVSTVRNITVQIIQAVVANAGADVTNCNSPILRLAGNAPAPGVGLWTVIAPANGATLSANNVPNPTVNGLAAGQYVDIEWRITTGTCISRDTVRVSNYFANAPACNCDHIYSISGANASSYAANEIRILNRLNGTYGTRVGNILGAPSVISVYGFGLDTVYKRFYYANVATAEIRYMDSYGNDVSTGVTLPGGAGVTYNRAGYNPVDKKMYFISNDASSWVAYSPTASGLGGAAVLMTAVNYFPASAPTVSAGGDIVFDAEGNGYILTNAGQFYKTVFTGSVVNIIYLGTLNLPPGFLLASLAFGVDNKLYLGGAGLSNGTGGFQGANVYSINLETLATVQLNTTGLTSATVDFTSCSFPFYNSIIEPTKTYNKYGSAGTNIANGDTLEYVIKVKNTGNISAGYVRMLDLIPAGTVYVPNSTNVNNLAVTDTLGGFRFAIPGGYLINGSNQAWRSGSIPPGDSATIKFKVRVNITCGTVVNTANIYNGLLNIVTQTNTLSVSATDPAVSNAGVDQTKCSNGNFTMAATSAPSVATGVWTIVGAANGAVVNSPTSGTSLVTGLNPNSSVTLRWTVSTACSSSSDDVVLTNATAPTIALGTIPSVCLGSLSATLPYSATTNNPDQYSIVFNAAALSAGFVNVTNAALSGSPISITIPAGVPAATYNAILTIRNSLTGCTANQSIAFTINPTPTANAGNPVTVCSGSGIAIGAAAVAGNTYDWSPATGLSSANVSNPTANPTVTTTYTVTVTNASGCTATSSVVVTVITLAPANAGPDQSNCTGNTFTMNATAPAVGSGAWSVLSGTATIATPTSRTSAVTLISTSAILRWTVTSGICQVTDDVEIIRGSATVNPGLIMISQTGCGAFDPDIFTDNIPATASSGTVTYQWASSTTSSIYTGFVSQWTNIAGATGSTYNPPFTTQTTYFVRLATVSGCATVVTVPSNVVWAVVQNSNITLTATPSGPICEGTNVTFNVTGTAPLLNLVTNGDFTQGLTGFGSDFSYDPNTNATSAYCGSYKVGTLPSPIADWGTSCPDEGHGRVLMVNGIGGAKFWKYNVSVLPNTTYRFQFQVAKLSPNNSSNLRFYIGTNNIEQFSLSSYNTCEWTTFTEDWFSGSNSGVIEISLENLNNNCNNVGNDFMLDNMVFRTVDLVDISTLSGTWNWTGPNGFTSTTQSPTLTGITATQAGVYNVNFSVNGCTGTASTTLSVRPTPTAPPVLPVAYCQGVTASALTATGVGLRWYTTATGGTGSSTAPIPSTTTAGTQNYWVSQTVGGCESPRSQITVTIRELPSVSAVSNQSICSGANTTAISFGGSTVAGTTYNWTNNNTSIGLSASGTGNIASFVATNNTGTDVVATITVTPNANGCAGTPRVFTITVKALPTVIIPVIAPICSSNSVTISATGGGTYAWSSGQTIASFSVSPTITTTYTVTVTNAGSCTATASRVVTVNPLPTAAIAASGSTTFCAGGSVTLTATGGGTYEWSSGETTAAVVKNATGTYTVTVTGTGGCRATASQTVTVNPLPTITLGANPSVCSGITSAELTYSATTGSPDQYSIDFNATAEGFGFSDVPMIALTSSPIIITVPAGVPNGTYNAVLTVRNTTTGCLSAAQAIQVIVQPRPTVNAGLDQTVCTNTFTVTGSTLTASQTGEWTVVSGIATITSPTTASTSVTIPPSSAATLRWTVSNATCSSSDDVVLTSAMANAGEDQTMCAPPSFIMSAVTPLAGTGTWTIIGGSATITSRNSPTTSVTVPVGTIAILRWTVNTGVCSSFDDITLSNFQSFIADAGPDQAQCNNSNATFTANSNSVAACAAGAAIVNGGFELPFQAPSTFSLVNESTVAGWKTTAADDKIEIWGTGFNGVPSYQGNQFVELNANLTSALYQDLCVLPGDSINWSVAHRGRSGVDNMVIRIGIPGALVTQRSVSTGNTAWVVYTGGYRVPMGQTVTRFQFEAVSTANGSNSVGNFIDDVNINIITRQPIPGVWTLVSGTATIANPNNPNTTVTGVPAGTSATLRWTSNNGVCSSFDDVVYTNNALPTITLGSNPSVCKGITTANLPYSTTTGNPNQYSIVFSTAAINAGFVNVTNATLTSSPIVVTVPAGAAADTYNATIVVRNSITGCVSVVQNIQIKVDEITTATVTANPAQCNNGTFVLGGNAPVSPAVGVWSVVSPASYNISNISAITSNTATASGVPAGTSVTLAWTVSNGACSSSSTVVLTNDILPISNASTDQTQCNNGSFTLAGNTPSVGSGVWSIVGAANGATITTPSSATSSVTNLTAGNSVTLRWTLTNGSCSSTDDVVLTNSAIPTPNITGVTTICRGASTTLTATGGGTYSWSTTETTAGITVSPASNTTYSVTVTNSSNCTAVANQLVTVNQPTNVDAYPNRILCAGNVLPAINFTGSGTSYTWVNNTPGIGLAASGTGNIAAFTTTNTGTTNLVATITVTPVANGCNGTPMTFTITVKPLPTVPITVNQIKCAGELSDVITLSTTGVTYNWTNSNTSIGLAATGSGTIPAFTTVNAGATPVVANINITPVSNGCTGPSTQVTITVNPKPTPNITGVTTICRGASTTLTATGGGTYLWSTTETTAGITVSPASNTTYSVTVTNSSNCTAVTNQLVTVNQPTNVDAYPNRILCAGDVLPAINFVGSGTSYTWVNNTPEIGLPASGTGNIAAFTTTNTGTTNLVATITVTPVANGCNGTPMMFTITVKPRPIVPTTPIQVKCAGELSDVITLSTTGVTYNWTNNNTSIGLAATGSGTIPAFTTVNAGTTPVVANINITPVSNGCIGPTVSVSITVNPKPTASISGTSTICNGSSTTLTAVGTGTYLWSTNETTAAITVSPTANATYTVTVTNSNNCTATASRVVTVDANVTANANVDQVQCNNGAFTLAGNTPSVGSGLWTIIGATNGTTIATPTSATTGVSGLTAGNSVTLRWTLTNSTCSSSDDVVLTNNANVTANANVDQAKCNNGSFTLAANIPTSPATGLWSIVGAANGATISTPTSATTGVTGLAAGSSVVLRWTVSNGTCSTDDDIILTNNESVVATANVDQAQCNSGAFTLAANTPSVGSGLWTIVGAANGITITTPTSETSGVTGLTAGSSVTLRWTVSNGTCSSSDDVVLRNNAPVTANAGLDQLKCVTGSFTLAGNVPTSPATGLWTIVGAANGTTISTPTSATTNISGLTAGNSVTLNWTVTNGTCSSSDEVIMTNNANVTATAGAAQAKCSNGSFTLAANAVTSPVVGTWSVVSPVGFSTSNISNVNSNTATVSNVVVGAPVTLRWTVANGACSSSSTVVLTNNPTPSVSAAPNAANYCSGTTITLNGTLISGNNTGATWSWAKPDGGAALTGQNPTRSNSTLAMAGVYTVTFTQANGCSATATTTVSVTQQPAVTSAGSNQTLCNTSAFNLNATAPAVGTGQWIWVRQAGASISDINDRNAIVTGVVAGDYAELIWRVTNGACFANSANIVLRNLPRPTATINAPITNACTGTSLTFAAGNVTTGVTYAWTFGAGSSVATATGANPASVAFSSCASRNVRLIANLNGCADTAYVLVNTNDTINPVFANRPANITVECDAIPPMATNVTPSDNCGIVRTDAFETSTYACDTATYFNGLNAPAVTSYWNAEGRIGDVGAATYEMDLNRPSPFATIGATPQARWHNGIYKKFTYIYNPNAVGANKVTYVLDNDTINLTVKMDPSNPATGAPFALDFDALRVTMSSSTATGTLAMDSVYLNGLKLDMPQPSVTGASRNVLATGWKLNQGFVLRGKVAMSWTGAIPTQSVLNYNISVGKLVTPCVADECKQQNYLISRTWIAEDGCNNTVAATQVIKVQDTKAPVLTVPANTTLECGSIPLVPTVTARDNCDATPTVTYNGEVTTQTTNGTCTDRNYTLTRTWTAVDNCGNTSTATQVITVIAAPLVDISTSSDAICENGSVSLSSVLDCRTGTAQTYQWQQSADASVWVNVASSGTTANYTASNLTQTTHFRLLVTQGACIGYSDTISIIVSPTPSVLVTVDNAAICQGGTVNLIANVSGGVGAISYQWQESSNGVTGWNDIASATNSIYRTVALSANRYYRVVITQTGAGCTKTSIATMITVANDPLVTTQPQGFTECIGGTLQLTVAASGGTPLLVYQWEQSLDGLTGWTDVASATSTVFTPNSTVKGTYYFRARVSATGVDCGTAYSNPATVIVAPDPEVQVTVPTTTVCTDGRVILTASPTGGTGTCTVQWQSKLDTSSTWNDVPGATGNTYQTDALKATSNYRAVMSCSGNGCCN
jgi:uncharacterized repeat protein (TIGR01451 family)